MVYYREGQVQRRIQKTMGSGNRPAQDDEAMNADLHHRYALSQKRTHVRPQKERQDQPDRTQDTIDDQPTPGQPADTTPAATGQVSELLQGCFICSRSSHSAFRAPLSGNSNEDGLASLSKFAVA
jgi:hypothetical protein